MINEAKLKEDVSIDFKNMFLLLSIRLCLGNVTDLNVGERNRMTMKRVNHKP
jgi:hypothetical protein